MKKGQEMAKSGTSCTCGRHLMENEDVCRSCGRPQTPAAAGLGIEQRLSLAEDQIKVNRQFVQGVADAITGHSR